MSVDCAREFDYVVVGLGQTGFSCARYLHAIGASFLVVDSREAPPMLAQFREAFGAQQALVLGEINSADLQRAGQLLVSPGVSLQEPAIVDALQAGCRMVSDIALFCQQVDKPVVAITGSNGKSTVTTLVGAMAANVGKKVAVAGNIGLPVLDVLLAEGGSRSDLYVLELSSFQLERLQDLNADVAVILNVSEDHLDRYSSFDDYAQAKQNVFCGARKIVVNRRDPLTIPDAQRFASSGFERLDYGLDKPDGENFGYELRNGEGCLLRGGKVLLKTSELKIAGLHNVENALAALAIGQHCGFPMQSMLKTLREFTGLPHRCFFYKELAGVRYINDSKGTNVGASLAALEGLGAELQGKIVLIAGGLGKGADFSPLAASMKRFGRAAVLIGKASHLIRECLRGVVEVFAADSMQEAVNRAAAVALEGDIVLLSPACASFDMFEGYEHRGEMFMRAVDNLEGRLDA